MSCRCICTRPSLHGLNCIADINPAKTVFYCNHESICEYHPEDCHKMYYTNHTIKTFSPDESFETRYGDSKIFKEPDKPYKQFMSVKSCITKVMQPINTNNYAFVTDCISTIITNPTIVV